MPEIGEIRKAKEIWPDKKWSCDSSPRQRWIYSTCKTCGKKRWILFQPNFPTSGLCNSCCQRDKHPSIETRLLRSEAMSRAKNPSWKGGRSYSRGYIYVLFESDDFFYSMTKNRGYVLEHRLIMAKSLKRCLLPWEIVHHKNGIRDDNRIENLKLIRGQTNHMPSIHVKQVFNKLNRHIKLMEQEITQLKTQLEARGVNA